jgi:predicted RNase H-like nuclease (RuvC/YqgF family)
MQHRPIVSSAIALLTTIGMLASTGAQAGMYRYEDENGRMVISNTIPQEATKRGYDILGNNGRVVETVPPAPTAEEIAAREAEKERQRQAELQRQKDEKLLERYSHPDQAVRAMHRKIREMEGMIQLKRGNISVISSQLNNEQSRAADMERAGREVPEASLEKIRRLEAQIDDVEQEIQNQRRQIEDMKDEFKADITRLETITGEERTLPLEPPENDSQ